jgi:hypothetical protein
MMVLFLHGGNTALITAARRLLPLQVFIEQFAAP